MKIAVLTSLFGSAEPLRSLSEREMEYKKDVDFFAYVDEEHSESQGWTQVVSPVFSSDPNFGYRRSAKLPKVLPHLLHPNYDAYLWIDSCQIPNMHPSKIYEKYLDKHDLALFKHPARTCAYEEGKVCAGAIDGVVKDDPKLIQDQLNFYLGTQFPQNYGLYELSSFMVNNNDTTKELSLIWWEQICKYSSRDQISFPFCLFRIQKDVNISIIPGFIHNPQGPHLPTGNEVFERSNEPALYRKF